jgi:hypothetical protein
VYAPLESSSDSSVELPWNVRCAEYKYAFRVSPYAVHLYEHFGLDTSRGFRFAFTAGTAESIDFIYEDD